MQSKIVCCEPLGDWGESFLTAYAGFTFGEHVKYTSRYVSGCLWPEIVHPSQWAVVVCVEWSHFNSYHQGVLPLLVKELIHRQLQEEGVGNLRQGWMPP